MPESREGATGRFCPRGRADRQCRERLGLPSRLVLVMSSSHVLFPRLEPCSEKVIDGVQPLLPARWSHQPQLDLDFTGLRQVDRFRGPKNSILVDGMNHMHRKLLAGSSWPRLVTTSILLWCP